MKKTTMLIAAAIAAATAIADAPADAAPPPRSAATIRADFAALSNSADRVAYADALTAAEWRGFADAVIAEAQAAENPSNLYAYADSYILFHMGNPWKQNKCAELAAEYDAKFAAAGFATNPYRYGLLPRCSENYLAAPKGDVMIAHCPVYVALLRKYKVSKLWTVCTPAERINYIAEHIAHGLIDYGPTIAGKKSSMLQAGAKIVKRAIRERGGSFVAGSRGATQLKAALDDLAGILDMPRMNGLAEWMAEWCPGYQWQEPQWMTTSEANELVEEILYGDTTLTTSNALRLCGVLGVAGYNSFVLNYNGGVAQ